LTLTDGLAAAGAARAGATTATALADLLARQARGPRPWRASPAAWRAVQLGYTPFHDISTLRRGDSLVTGWSAAVADGLREVHASLVGTIDGVRVGVDGVDLDRVATGLRGIVNQLPELAQLLERSVEHWADTRHLFAPERRLPSYELRNDAVTSADRVVQVERPDLLELIHALRDTDRLSLSLCAELDRTADSVGHQPQPRLAAAFTATVTDEAVQRALARSAASARLHGSAAPPEWTRPSRPARSTAPAR
jgi:predicted NBD/HSP70 family sugar kinase